LGAKHKIVFPLDDENVFDYSTGKDTKYTIEDYVKILAEEIKSVRQSSPFTV